jgi:hypothetical protein
MFLEPGDLIIITCNNLSNNPFNFTYNLKLTIIDQCSNCYIKPPNRFNHGGPPNSSNPYDLSKPYDPTDPNDPSNPTNNPILENNFQYELGLYDFNNKDKDKDINKNKVNLLWG